MLKGRFAYQFERARDYCEELRSSNPGATTKITLHTPTLHFKRMYVCLAVVELDLWMNVGQLLVLMLVI